MAYTVDILLAVIFILAIGVSAYKGFFKSLIDLAGSLVAVVFARLLSQSLALPLYNSVIASGVEQTLANKLGDGATVDYSQQLEDIFSSLPESINGILQLLGIDKQMLFEKVSSANLNGDNLVESLMNSVVSPLVTAVLQFILFVILAIVLIVVVKIVAALLDKIIKKLPVIKSFNKTLGAVFGILRGLIDVVIISMLISVVVGLIGNQELIASVDNSIIVNTVSNIFSSLMGIKF